VQALRSGRLVGGLRDDLDELQRQMVDMRRQLAEAIAREAEMRLKYNQLDIFKLDMIARELKKLENKIGIVRDKTKGHGLDAKGLTDFASKECIASYAHDAGETLSACKAHIREVIEQCFSELQKMHIGVPATEEGLRKH
jgi:CRP-like cAMP-binding protein